MAVCLYSQFFIIYEYDTTFIINIIIIIFENLLKSEQRTDTHTGVTRLLHCALSRSRYISTKLRLYKYIYHTSVSY